MAARDWLDAVLGLGPEWKVTSLEPARKPKELRVELQRPGGNPLRCPHCGEACPATTRGFPCNAVSIPAILDGFPAVAARWSQT